MFFRHVFFREPEKLRERRIKGKRHYLSPKGNYLPSVTTVLSLLSEDGLKAWRKRVGEAEANRVSERATKNGTIFHKVVENYLNNKDTLKPPSQVVKKLFEQIKPELHKINNIRAQEVNLFSDGIGIAGRVDCVAEYDGVLSIIDFKTSRKKKQKSWILSYFLQSTAYAIMFEELVGTPINQIVVLVSAEDNTIKAFVEDKAQYIEPLKEIIEDYKLRLEFEIE